MRCAPGICARPNTLYLLYTSPLGDIVRCHDLLFHFYNHDSQLYLSCKPMEPEQTTSIPTLEACVRGIDTVCGWYLNRGKTGLLVIGSQYQPRLSIKSIHIAGECVQPSVSARNIGAVFNQNNSFERHVGNICKTAFYHLLNIAKNKELPLTDWHWNTCPVAFISTKLDNCNSLLYGLSDHLIDRLQYVQNSAARM